MRCISVVSVYILIRPRYVFDKKFYPKLIKRNFSLFYCTLVILSNRTIETGYFTNEPEIFFGLRDKPLVKIIVLMLYMRNFYLLQKLEIIILFVIIKEWVFNKGCLWKQ